MKRQEILAVLTVAAVILVAGSARLWNSVDRTVTRGRIIPAHKLVEQRRIEVQRSAVELRRTATLGPARHRCTQGPPVVHRVRSNWVSETGRVVEEWWLTRNQSRMDVHSLVIHSSDPHELNASSTTTLAFNTTNVAVPFNWHSWRSTRNRWRVVGYNATRGDRLGWFWCSSPPVSVLVNQNETISVGRALRGTSQRQPESDHPVRTDEVVAEAQLVQHGLAWQNRSHRVRSTQCSMLFGDAGSVDRQKKFSLRGCMSGVNVLFVGHSHMRYAVKELCSILAVIESGVRKGQPVPRCWLSHPNFGYHAVQYEVRPDHIAVMKELYPSPTHVVYARGLWDQLFNNTQPDDYVRSMAAGLQRLVKSYPSARHIVYMQHHGIPPRGRKAYGRKCAAVPRQRMYRHLNLCAVAAVNEALGDGVPTVEVFDPWHITRTTLAAPFADPWGHHYTGPVLRTIIELLAQHICGFSGVATATQSSTTQKKKIAVDAGGEERMDVARWFTPRQLPLVGISQLDGAPLQCQATVLEQYVNDSYLSPCPEPTVDQN